MKKSRVTEEQIIGFLRRAEAGKIVNLYVDDETEFDLRGRFEDRVPKLKKSKFDLVQGHE